MLACTLIVIGFLTFMIGLVADVIASNRKILQDTQYHVRKAEYDALYRQQKKEQGREEVKVTENEDQEMRERQMEVEKKLGLDNYLKVAGNVGSRVAKG